MATLTDPPVRPSSRSRPQPRARGWRRVVRRDWPVLLVCIVTVALRLPFLASHPGSDESGFLMVAGQWFSGTGSLYGAYWVDRPPLLFTIFWVAHLLGGLVALRLIGCVFVAAAIYLTARLVRVLAHDAPDDAHGAGPGAVWAAIAMAALFNCVMLGTFEVNGELLASAFVAAGFLATVVAVRAAGGLSRGETDGGSSGAVWPAGLAGACGMVAVLIKQNFIDVFVFATVALVACVVAKRITPAQALRTALAGAGGAAVVTAATALWTALHGTSLGGIVYAMYPFRIAAGIVTAKYDPGTADARGHALLISSVTSGMVPLVLLLFGVLAVTRPRSPLLVGLVAEIVYTAVSIAMGGSYWLHYLIQLIVPTAALLGYVLARGTGWLRLAVIGLVALMAADVPFTGSVTGGGEGARTGAALHEAGRPGDTITTIYGHSEIDFAAGMASPYEQLWALPIRTLDPHLTRLQQVLSGRSAPTWFVSFSGVRSWGIAPRGADTVDRLLQQRYHEVAVLCGHAVYLRDGVQRATPVAPRRCDAG